MMTLRLNIDGNWSAQDFTEYFASLNYIYTVFAVTEIELNSMREWDLDLEKFADIVRKLPRSKQRNRHLRAFQRSLSSAPFRLLDASNLERSFAVLEDREKLQVRCLKFASDGVSDVSGLGQAMGHLKDIVIKLIDVKVNSNERRIKSEILEEERRSAALRNLREEISILKELGYSESDVRAIVAASKSSVEKLASLANRGLLTGVSEIDGNCKC